jgi:hypothetical protein
MKASAAALGLSFSNIRHGNRLFRDLAGRGAAMSVTAKPPPRTPTPTGT